ncbi:MAG: hypothetical protein KDJ38_15085, partial [Gammaproteobacteria bacterium]|nr:hypothetical protein [Gammaproteobacteria bacterium]
GLLIEHSIKDADEDKPAGLVLFRQSEESLEIGEAIADIEERPCEDEISLFARGVYSTPGINLLQGEYSFKQQFDRVWKPWRPAMAMAVVLGLVIGIGKYIEYQKQSTLVNAQTAEMEKILKRTFPSINRVVNPRLQMQTELKKLGAGGLESGFVAAINGISNALGEAGNTNLNAISYKTGRLDLDLDTDQLGTLDKLKQTLESDGKYSMTIESANQSNGRIRGRIRVEVRG